MGLFFRATIIKAYGHVALGVYIDQGASRRAKVDRAASAEPRRSKRSRSGGRSKGASGSA